MSLSDMAKTNLDMIIQCARNNELFPAKVKIDELVRAGYVRVETFRKQTSGKTSQIRVVTIIKGDHSGEKTAVPEWAKNSTPFEVADTRPAEDIRALGLLTPNQAAGGRRRSPSSLSLPADW